MAVNVYAPPQTAVLSNGGFNPDNQSADSAARGAGYYWDPVQNKYVKGDMTSAQAISRANTQADYINTLFGRLPQSLTGLAASGGYNLGGIPHIQDYGGPASIKAVNPADPSAANAARFGAAKDQAGESAAASLRALRGELAASGQMGSGGGNDAIRQALKSAAQPVNDVIRSQSVQDQQTNNQFAQFNTQMQLAQRGQDATLLAAQRQADLAQRSQDISMRGQDLQAQEAAAASQKQVLAGLLGSLNISASSSD